MAPHQTTESTLSGEKISPAELNGNAEATPVSKLRQALPQFFAVSAKNILLITFGSSLGFSTILIPELQKENPEIEVTLEQLTWISSFNLILVPVGCLISGPISQCFGRKRTMMISNLPFVIAWIIFHRAQSASMLFVALSLTGLSGGLLEAPVLTYVAEVTQPHLRGMLSATSTMSVILGVFSQLLAGSLTTWRTVALINIAFPVACFVALCMVPESPHWLAAKNRLKESEEALCWLRGWVTPHHVRNEFCQLCEVARKPAEKNTETTSRSEKVWKPYTKKTFYKPFALVSLAFFIGAFGGITSLQTFAVVIFARLNAPIDKYTATVFLGIAELVGTAFCVVAIHFTGKRKLSFLSSGGTGISFGCAAIYSYMVDHRSILGDDYTWIPTTFLITAAFMSHLCIRLLPWVLIGEVFPGEVRSGASGAAGSIGYIFNFIVNKAFFYMLNGIALAGTFWFYSMVNIIGAIVLFFVLPETEGRTLREIEEHYAGIHNLKDRPKKEEFPFKEKWAARNVAIVNDDVESRL
ncbi:facilitated trehalose transporter Tret1 isoform X2 [Orussus abietinus]|uniref:facilitated trehalose transporter Tret1 isoform X2 n=1 Tax=Orussus abietinus TaxID=222816 RepID=UPI000625BF55|nr:facilitated trehalose transporter Tret1 isoform X2 [Orussus abietinus]